MKYVLLFLLLLFIASCTDTPAGSLIKEINPGDIDRNDVMGLTVGILEDYEKECSKEGCLFTLDILVHKSHEEFYFFGGKDTFTRQDKGRSIKIWFSPDRTLKNFEFFDSIEERERIE